MSDESLPRTPQHDPHDGPTPPANLEIQPGDTYMEGPYLVFTEQYHLRRGYCCNSDCRHCPFR